MELSMALWMQILLGSAAAVTALGVLWQKVFRPTMRAAATAEEMLPLLVDLTRVFRGTPHAFEVLDAIVAQFRTDSGSSLRDAVNRLEVAAQQQTASAAILKVEAETTRQLAQRDREQIERLMLTLDRLQIKVGEGAVVTDRIEAATKVVAIDLTSAQQEVDRVAANLIKAQAAVDEVATNLTRQQQAVDGVASDLAAAQDRANRVRDAVLPGEALDSGALADAAAAGELEAVDGTP